MKKYDVILGFWRNGQFVEAGSAVDLSKNEAKYLKHALSEVGLFEVQPEPAPEPDVEPVLNVEVVEKPVSAGKRRRNPDATNDNSN